MEIKIEFDVPQPSGERGNTKYAKEFSRLKHGASIYIEDVKDGRNVAAALKLYIQKKKLNWTLLTRQQYPGLRIWVNERN